MSTIYQALPGAESVLTNNPTLCLGNYRILLKNDSIEAEIEGRLDFRSLPAPHVRFTGLANEEKQPRNALFVMEQNYEASVDGLKIGNLLVRHFNETDLSVDAELYGEMTLGDKSISVTKVGFLIPNLIDLPGKLVRYMDGTIDASRHVFTDDKISVTIDKVKNFKGALSDWWENGGLSFLYAGEISKTDGSAIGFEESKKILEDLGIFLSFLNGRRTSPLLVRGLDNEGGVGHWYDCSTYQNDLSWNTHVRSWPVQNLKQDFSAIWQNLRKLSGNDVDRHFIRSAIQWYLYANANPRNPNAPLILAQTAM